MPSKKAPWRIFTDAWTRRWLREECVAAVSRELYLTKVREPEDDPEGEELIEEGESVKIFLRDPAVPDTEAEIEVHAYENPPEEIAAGKSDVEYEIQAYVNHTFRRSEIDQDRFLTEAYNFFHAAGVETPVFWFIATADTEAHEGKVVQEVRVELRHRLDRTEVDSQEVLFLGRLYLKFMGKMCEEEKGGGLDDLGTHGDGQALPP